MGLICWLPLTGTVENKGVSNITVTNNGATVDTNGKIGSCYSFNGNNYYISLVGQQLFDCFKGENQQFSMCMWVYHADSRRAILFGDWSLSNSIGFNIELSTGHGVRFYWNGSPDYSPGINVGASTWNHIAFTYDGTALRSYLNGSLIATRSGALAARSKTAGEFRLGRDNRTTDTALNGKLNDVRIYKDHCLSAAEVHEISQGLVLHYKLDGFMRGTNSNLAQGSRLLATASSLTNHNISKRGSPTIEMRTDGFAQVKGTAAWQGFSLWSNSLNLKVDTTYTYSFYGYTALSTSTNAGISLYPMMYNSAGTRDTSSTLPISVMGGTFTNSNAKQIGKLNTTPQLYWATFTWNQTMANIIANGGKIELSIQIHGTFDTGRIDYLWAPKLELGDKPTAWTPSIEEMGIDLTKIQDSSGYNHNGTINGNIIISSDTNRYNYSTQFDGIDDSITVPYNAICPENIFTFNLWFKKDALGSKNYETLFGGPSGFEMDTRAGAATSLSLYMASTRSGNRNAVTSLSLGNWYMITMTRDGTKEKYYVNGIYQSEIDAKTMPTGVYRIGAWASNTGQNYYGLISDFRIYCTALSADDILSLYHTAAKVDNLGELHTFEAIENLPNIIFKIDSARGAKVFQDGLSRYTQSQCQVTLTDEGYHIYRPPNLVYSSAGKVMLGGLKLVNQTSDTISPYNANRDNVWGLQKTHTYLFAFHAKGQSSNSPSLNVQNNMGWDRIAGIGPNPTYISTSTIPANFNGEKDCYIIFTINDDIIKTATETKGGYITGEQYLSYRDLSLNYGYTDTGALGTDLYLTDFRLYDITNYIGQIKKTGITNFSDYVERNGILQIRNRAELLTSNLIEH